MQGTRSPRQQSLERINIQAPPSLHKTTVASTNTKGYPQQLHRLLYHYTGHSTGPFTNTKIHNYTGPSTTNMPCTTNTQVPPSPQRSIHKYTELSINTTQAPPSLLHRPLHNHIAVEYEMLPKEQHIIQLKYRSIYNRLTHIPKTIS